jgi:hypothetical protein
MLGRIDFFGFALRSSSVLVGFGAAMVSCALGAVSFPAAGATGVASRWVKSLLPMCFSLHVRAYADSAANAFVDLCVCVCN